jgi:hypothetical protein
MKVIIASVVIALLTVSAFAQDAAGGKRHGRHAQTTDQPKKKVDDGAYKSALKRIPDQQKPADPWESLRSGAR